MDAALVILDGWGLGAEAEFPGHVPTPGGRDAVARADTPAFDRATRAGATAILTTSGRSVGLPEGQAGNSEVGHLTIGAGRVVDQAYTRIEDAIAAGTLRDRPAIEGALDHAAATGGRLHLLGLLSDGGVHADHEHLHALIELAAERGVPAVTHPFTDGRDTSPTAGERFVARLEAVADAAGTGHPATVMGRYYAMDRDENWDRTRRAFEAIVDRQADHRAETATAAVRAAYERGETDEFIEPTVLADRPELADGDAAVFCNFRADRARQLTRMLAGIDPPERAPEPPAIHLATMTEYDEDYDLPVAFPPNEPGETLGVALASVGRRQLRVAESEKYAHVTYFLDGGRETPLEGERREIVPSPDVPTYDERPAMNASQVTDRVLTAVDEDDPSVAVVNYANPDMVGHTGNFDAAVAAVEAVDAELSRLVPALRETGAAVLLVADHGNADDLGTPEDPHTAHTRNPVPLVALSPDGTLGQRDGADGGWTVRQPAADRHGLATLAPTLLALAGVEIPGEMTEAPLFGSSKA